MEADVNKYRRELKGKSSQEVIRYFFDFYKDKVVLASSLGLEDQVLTDMCLKIDPHLTLSIGICCVPVTQNITARDLITRADDALRLAKKNGRNRVEMA